MKKIEMSEKAYIIVGDLTNVHRAQEALRNITQANSKDYIRQEDYQQVMAILAKWSDEMFERIEDTGDEAQQSVDPDVCPETGKPHKWFQDQGMEGYQQCWDCNKQRLK
jgi:hypothetical protein